MTKAQAHNGGQQAASSTQVPEALNSLKSRIETHYEVASDYFFSLWGEHIHHGYFKSPNDTKEQAQINLIHYLLEISDLPAGSKVLDVGCGIGGTSRFLAKERGCKVTGITNSKRQVQIAEGITASEVPLWSPSDSGPAEYPGAGSVQFLQLDADAMLDHFSARGETFDCVWICETLYHLPNKAHFFNSAFSLLANSRSRLVVADWFRPTDLTTEQERRDIKPIQEGMLTQRLFDEEEYLQLAEEAGFRVRQAPINISKYVAKTWNISWSLVASPSVWLYAIWQGRDGIGFLLGIRAMKRGYANGTFMYKIMCFEKP
ncbi:hypothetical protein DL765_009718 [Monosporascus sp. GIB2]|nr:hypothetical protein DL765_009718 [Monosporascus sp. GIB2]